MKIRMVAPIPMIIQLEDLSLSQYGTGSHPRKKQRSKNCRKGFACLALVGRVEQHDTSHRAC